MLKFFNLKLHDGGEGVEGVSTAPAIDSPAPQVVYGKSAESTEPIASAPAASEVNPASEWEGVKEKYKDLYSADVRTNIDRRLKGKAREMQEMMAIIDPLTKYFGLQDMKTLKDFVHSDLVPTLQGYQLPEYDPMADDGGQAPEVTLSPAELATQATDLIEKYADFDLEAELPALQPLLARGLSLEQAYKLQNFDQLLQKETIKVAEAQKKATIESIRTKGLQAVDEAVSKPAPAVVHKSDPSTWSDADIEEVLRQVNRGAKIRL